MFRELGPNGVVQVSTVFYAVNTDSSCFEPDSELASQMGIQKRRRLKDDAIPTLFERPGSQISHLSQAYAGTSGTLTKESIG